MKLDIDTPKGQISLQQEQKMLEAVERIYNVNVIQTNKSKPCEVDGFIVKNGIIVGVFESKCRNMSLAQLQAKFNNEWLITFDKVLAGLKCSKLFRVPYFGFLYLIEDGIGIKLKISDEMGNLIVKVIVDRTETQRNVNGGAVVRTNSFVDVSSGVQFPI